MMLTFFSFFAVIYIILIAACSKPSSTTSTHEKITPHKQHREHVSALSPGWYPNNATQLNRELEYILKLSKQYFQVPVDARSVKALVVPHAGIAYSGLCAGTAYQTLLNHDGTKNNTIKRVIIIAPSHAVFYNGIALPNYTLYKNNLGEIPVDTQSLQKLQKDPLFAPYPMAHEKEHAIEMHIPFIQKTVADCAIVPLIVGKLTLEDPWRAAAMIERIIDDQTLIVVSTDFTHHGNAYEYKIFDANIASQLRQLDGYAAHALVQQSLRAFYDVLEQTQATICGREPFKILLALLEKNYLGPVAAHTSCYYTSSHITNARKHNSNTIDVKALFNDPTDAEMTNSVSYLSIVFAQSQHTQTVSTLLTGYEKMALLHTARTALINAFRKKESQQKLTDLAPIASAGLMAPAGAFVTLTTKQGALRGCIGRIVSSEPLFKTVHSMALSAAFDDNRFTPLTINELETIVIDVTVLGQPQPVASYHDIILGKHGIILKQQKATGQTKTSAVFLPQVPQQFGWNLKTTLEQLSLKAGLKRDAWKNCSFEIFEGCEIKE